MLKSLFCGRENELAVLTREWHRATEADGQPQVVVLLADNGLGKTRLVQELFGRLSTTIDAAGSNGYWPDDLEFRGDNLLVNPDPDLCNAKHEPPFLWWGLRFTDGRERNAGLAGMDENLPALYAHLTVLLAGVRNGTRRHQALAAAGDAILDFALEAAGTAVPHVSLAKTIAAFIHRSVGLVRQHLANRETPDLGSLRQQHQVSKAEQLVRSISHVLKARDERLPICIFADDGHFSETDPDTVDLLRRLLDAARADRWPMLMLITHWHDKWNGSASPIARWLKPQADRIVRLPFGKLQAQSLSPVLAQHVSGLLPDQTRAILGRADGNPQYLEEIILYMLERRGFFVGADTRASLTPAGFGEVMHASVRRHELNRRRFFDLAPTAQGALAVGSLQGQRLSEQLTTEVCASVGFPDMQAVRNGLVTAEMPHNLIKRERGWAEFLQQLYREIAEQEMQHIPLDRGAALTALIACLRNHVTDPDALAGLSREDRLATLGLAWSILRDAPAEVDASIAALSAVALIAERFASRDYLGAGAQAQLLVDTMRSRIAH